MGGQKKKKKEKEKNIYQNQSLHWCLWPASKTSVNSSVPSREMHIAGPANENSHATWLALSLATRAKSAYSRDRPGELTGRRRKLCQLISMQHCNGMVLTSLAWTEKKRKRKKERKKKESSREFVCTLDVSNLLLVAKSLAASSSSRYMV